MHSNPRAMAGPNSVVGIGSGTRRGGHTCARGLFTRASTSEPPLIIAAGRRRHGNERRPPWAAKIRPWRMLLWRVSRR